MAYVALLSSSAGIRRAGVWPGETRVGEKGELASPKRWLTFSPHLQVAQELLVGSGQATRSVGTSSELLVRRQVSQAPSPPLLLVLWKLTSQLSSMPSFPSLAPELLLDIFELSSEPIKGDSSLRANDPHLCRLALVARSWTAPARVILSRRVKKIYSEKHGAALSFAPPYSPASVSPRLPRRYLYTCANPLVQRRA